jgi:hypothetical protein
MSENKSWINCYETEGYKQLIENFLLGNKLYSAKFSHRKALA